MIWVQTQKAFSQIWSPIGYLFAGKLAEVFVETLSCLRQNLRKHLWNSVVFAEKLVETLVEILVVLAEKLAETCVETLVMFAGNVVETRVAFAEKLAETFVETRVVPWFP